LALWLRAAGALGGATGAASGSSGPGRTKAGDAVDDDDDDDAWHGMVSAADVDSLFRPDLPDFSRKPQIAPGPSDAPRRKASRGHSGDSVASPPCLESRRNSSHLTPRQKGGEKSSNNF
jgi:hypothetical protein